MWFLYLSLPSPLLVIHLLFELMKFNFCSPHRDGKRVQLLFHQSARSLASPPGTCSAGTGEDPQPPVCCIAGHQSTALLAVWPWPGVAASLQPPHTPTRPCLHSPGRWECRSRARAHRRLSPKAGGWTFAACHPHLSCEGLVFFHSKTANPRRTNKQTKCNLSAY